MLSDLFYRLRALFRREPMEQELDEEVRAHLEHLAEKHVKAGLTREEATRRARLEFGGLEQVKEECRDARGVNFIETTIQDVRYGLRMLWKDPGFTLVSVLTLALGIGATTAIFTVFNAVLLRPLPYPHPGELVYIKENLGPPVGILPFAFSRDFASWRNQSRTLSQVAAYMYSWFNLTGGSEPERVTCGMASSSFFSLLGVHPEVGRVFLPEEDRPGSPPVAIVSHALWKRRLGGDPSAVGGGLTLDGKTYTVVGVLPATFVIPDRDRLDYDVWIALPLSETDPGRFPAVRAIGRLKSGVSIEVARSELDSISKSAAVKGLKRSVVVSAWHEEISGGARLSLLLFLGAVGFLLLIACVNVANLQLSRAAGRQKEIAVRLAMGAGGTRILRQLLTESILLALVGGLIGLGLARWGKSLFVAFISANLPRLEPIGLDWRVLGFNLGLAVLTGLAFGLVPALQAPRFSLNEALKEASRSAPQFRSRLLLRKVLIICETALAMVLLAGSGLLFRSFLRVRGIDTGFKSKHILSLTVDLAPSRYVTPSDQARFFQQVLEGLKGLAGVESVGGSSSPPLGGYFAAVPELTVEGRPEKILSTPFATVSPDYFRTIQIPLVQGRWFAGNDREGSPSVAIVNESFARRYFSGENCLGKRFESWIRKNDWITIVGVVGDVRNYLESEPSPEIYLPYLQVGGPHMTLVVRTAQNPKLWVGAVRSRIASVDKDQPPYDLMTWDELRAVSLTPRRVNMLLLGAFAGLGLFLASIGIYGVVSYSVSQRRHELGVRMALGAGQGKILKLVVGEGLCLALIGTGIGLAASLAITRLLRTFLFGVKPTDPLTFVAVPLILAAVALLACYIPARRATKVDPTVALRHE